MDNPTQKSHFDVVFGLKVDDGEESEPDTKAGVGKSRQRR